MTAVLAGEIFGGFIVFAVLCSLSLVAFCHYFCGDDSLRFLDGRPLGSALDDRDRERHLLDVALAEDAVVAELDSWFALPARDHR